MAETTRVLLIFVMGMALGAIYFAGLWYTVRRLPDAKRPLNCLLCSFLLRASIALAGFGLVMDGRWDQLIAVLGGFILTREILVRRLGQYTSKSC
jgi:F1F0 ATPase subunit 2